MDTTILIGIITTLIGVLLALVKAVAALLNAAVGASRFFYEVGRDVSESRERR